MSIQEMRMKNKEPKDYKKTDASFIRALKCTARLLDPAGKIYLAQLISADEYFANTRHEERDDFYTTREYTEEVTGLSPKVQKRCEKKLVKLGIIQVTGIPNSANSYVINYPLIKKLDDEYTVHFKQFIAMRKERNEKAAVRRYDLESKEAEHLWSDEGMSAQMVAMGLPNGTQGGAQWEPSDCPFGGANDNNKIEHINNNKKSSATFLKSHPDPSVPALNLETSTPALNLETLTPALNLETSTPARNFESSAPARNFESSVPALYDYDVKLGMQSSLTPSKTKSIRALLNAYNKIMKLDYRACDLHAAESNEKKLRLIEKYINPVALHYIWHNVADEGAKQKANDKWMAAFLGFGMPEKILKKQSEIWAYCYQELSIKLDKIFRENAGSVKEVLKGTKYRCDTLGNLEPIENNVFFPDKQHVLLKCEILKKHLAGRLSMDERHDIMEAMEAF